ncbi:uncharacterized protein ACBR49_002037 [Aulostomus maculatus]
MQTVINASECDLQRSKVTWQQAEMYHGRPQETHQSKGSMLRLKEHRVDMRPTDDSVSPTQRENRPIRRVRSPSKPRARMTSSHKLTSGGRSYKPDRTDRLITKSTSCTRDGHSFYKHCRLGYQRYHHLKPCSGFHHRDRFKPKLHQYALRELYRETELYEQRDDGSSPSKQIDATRASNSSSTSSRVKDTEFNLFQSSRKQNRARDHRGTACKDRKCSGDGEIPSTASQAAARDRAIKQKRKEIDEVYYQECEMFGLVVKMLIEKDPSLEHSIQASLQENLREIGKRCLEAMERFIEEYDSKESSH